MRKDLESLGLPPTVLNMLENYPVVPPSFPTNQDSRHMDSPDETDIRIIPGGPSSSALLRLREKLTREDLESLLQEVRRVHFKADAALTQLSGMSTHFNLIASTLASLNAVTGDAGVIDFYVPGAGLLTSNCVHDSFWGQITLPYANSPQSMIRRDSRGSRPGTVVRYAYGNSGAWSPSYVNDSTFWDESDPTVEYAIDGQLDTAWSVNVASSNDLLVSISLPPTMAANASMNSLGIVPWPLGGASIVDVQIRTGDVVSGLTPGWKQLTLAGQVNYTSADGGRIDGALAHRFFFPPATVKEIVVRLRPLNADSYPAQLGLTLVDCWSIDFKPAGSIVLDSSEVGINDIALVTLGGHDPSSLLSNTGVTVAGTEVTLDISSSGPGVTPVYTSVAFKKPAEGASDTGFDVDVFAP